MCNCDVQTVLQSIQNTADKPLPSGSGTGKQADENYCQSSVANHVNKGNVSANCQNVNIESDSDCDTVSSTASSVLPAATSQAEMLVF